MVAKRAAPVWLRNSPLILACDEIVPIERVLTGLADELHSYVLDHQANKATVAAKTMPRRSRRR